MINYKQLTKTALAEALKLRIKSKKDKVEVFDIFDFSESLGIEVRFVDIPSMEAMYIKSKRPSILISTHRPYGRQVFNCAHELGHHVFDHGTKVDEITENHLKPMKLSPEEYLANSFASFLLMNKTQITFAFNSRGLDPEFATPQDYYAIAGWLGVGYTSLVNQMDSTLNLISKDKVKELLSTSPKLIRLEILGENTSNNLLIVDTKWDSRAIDASVGSYIIVPNQTIFEGNCVSCVRVEHNYILYQGQQPGIGRFVNSINNWASYVRVSKHGYIGRSSFRYLEDPEYGEDRTKYNNE